MLPQLSKEYGTIQLVIIEALTVSEITAMWSHMDGQAKGEADITRPGTSRTCGADDTPSIPPGPK